MTNCIVYSNAAAGVFGLDLLGAVTKVFYSCAPANAPAGQGNITASPKFVDFGNGDYRLAADSPCVNAGTNEPWMDGAVDLGGRPRLDPFARQADMGAYEYVPPGAAVQVEVRSCLSFRPAAASAAFGLRRRVAAFERR